MSDLLAEIAARYGATVSPGASLTVVARGVSSRPLPVWDGKRLTVPDWNEQKKAAQRAGVAASRRAAKFRAADTAARVEKLRELHVAGARVPVMAAALGVSVPYVYQLLSSLGLRIERDPAVNKGLVVRMVEARVSQMRAVEAERLTRIRALVERGATETDVAAALGLGDQTWVRKLIRKAVPDFVFVNRRRGPAPRPVLPPAQVQQTRTAEAERLTRIRALVEGGATDSDVAAALGLGDQTWVRKLIRKAVPDFVFVNCRRVPKPKVAEPRVRVAVPCSPAPKAVRRRGKAAKRAVHVARNADILARHKAGGVVEEIAAAMSLSRTVVKRVILGAGEAPFYASQRTTAERTSALPGLLAKGMTTAEIALDWDVTMHAVHALASRAGVSLRPTVGKPHNAGKTSPKVAARRAWIADQVRRGATDAEMLAVLGIHQSTLSADIKAVGLSGHRDSAGCAFVAVPQRRAA